MGNLLKAYLILLLANLVTCGIVQTLFPQFVTGDADWPLAVAWQREIGFWNFGLATLVVLVLMRQNAEAASLITISMLVLNILFGTNHLATVLGGPMRWWHLSGVLANYAGVAAAVVVLRFGRTGLRSLRC